MKKIFFILTFTFLFSILNAQNYQCIKTDAITHFQSSTGYIASIRIDSIFQNPDHTDYFSYAMIRPLDNDGNGYYTLKGASWIGEMFQVTQKGDNIFHNSLHESIIIKTPVFLNKTWEMYRSDSTKMIVTATVSKLEYLTFLELSDSVATITFSVTDTSGQVIQNPINNYFLKLSKSYGLITLFNFYRFPFTYQMDDMYINYISDTLNLIGMNNPLAGWQNSTAYDIYNWEPGWEFHSLEEYHPPIPPTVYDYSFSEKMIRIILDKTINTDSVIYQVERCYDYQRYSYSTDSFTEEYGRDTLIETYSFDSPINNLPFEPITKGDITFHVKTLSTISQTGGIFGNLHNDTINYLIFTGYTNFRWTKELGSEYYGEGFSSYNRWSYDFVYYKKDLIEWGQPYYCNILLNTKSELNPEDNIYIYPNPSEGKFTLQINNKNKLPVWVSIIDLTGKTLIENVSEGEKCDLNLTELKSGIYFIKIKMGKEFIVKKFIKN